MPIFDHFDFLAPVYDRAIKPKDPADLYRLANLPTQGRLLDAGGGTGRIAQFMADKASQVVVADLSFEMLVKSKEKGNLQPICSPAEYLPFSEQSFDRILMVDALHHVCDQEKTANELWRLLKPGGVIVIEEPDIRTFTIKLVAIAEKLALMRSRFMKPEAIASMFSASQARLNIERDGYISWIVVEKVNVRNE